MKRLYIAYVLWCAIAPAIPVGQHAINGLRQGQPQQVDGNGELHRGQGQAELRADGGQRRHTGSHG